MVVVEGNQPTDKFDFNLKIPLCEHISHMTYLIIIICSFYLCKLFAQLPSCLKSNSCITLLSSLTKRVISWKSKLEQNYVFFWRSWFFLSVSAIIQNPDRIQLTKYFSQPLSSHVTKLSKKSHFFAVYLNFKIKQNRVQNIQK